MHITFGLYFPTAIRSELVFCPHHQSVQTANYVRYRCMMGLFHIPLVPTGSAYQWHCNACGAQIVPNSAARYLKKILIRNSAFATIGLLMLAGFLAVALSIGGKNSIFDQSNMQASRYFFGMFSCLGLLILVYSVYDMRRIARDILYIGDLSPERLEYARSHLEENDDVAALTKKLGEAGLSAAEIQSFVGGWVKPE